MKNALSGIGGEIADFLRLIMVLIVGVAIVGAIVKLAPDNPTIQALGGTYLFLTRLVLDWGTPDPVLWIVRIVIIALAGLGLYSQSHGNR